MTSISTVRPRKIFVDTSAWYAGTSNNDAHHAEASNYLQHVLNDRIPLLTSDYVLDETLTRLRYDFGAAVAKTFLRLISKGEKDQSLSILWVDQKTWKEALQIFEKYDDQAFSFTDCTSFALIQSQAINEVFAFDEHFTMFGASVAPQP